MNGSPISTASPAKVAARLCGDLVHPCWCALLAHVAPASDRAITPPRTTKEVTAMTATRRPRTGRMMTGPRRVIHAGSPGTSAARRLLLSGPTKPHSPGKAC
jgi:hypothetical protein